jgi:nucleotide-binding universal stress UspA family protein
METILIATDFSSAARNATAYGFEMARRIKAKVILFTAYQPSLALPDSVLYLSPEDLERNSYKLLLDEAEAMDPKRTVALETQSRQGVVTTCILDAIQENNISLVVIGMKDRGKEIRKYFGSTVTHLCKSTTIPVIVVPAGALFSVPKTLVLASDITGDDDLQVLNPLKTMAKKFASRLFVVRVIKKSMEQEVEVTAGEARLSWYLTDVNPAFKFIHGENVARTLQTFVQKQAVDMVAVIPHEHNLFERLITRSVTKDLIFHTHVPLLILPGAGHPQQSAEKQFAFPRYGYGLVD